MRAGATLVKSAILLLGLALAWFVFAPGLTGPFIFDDLSNLDGLGKNGGITGLDAFLAFVFSGEAGRLGRPISLASFVLNGLDWPTDPWPFKYTNLLIHLLNGVLIFAICRQLARWTGIAERRRDWFAFAVAGIWLLHPIQLSTMMLVVQRMNQLATLFILAATLAYLHGRAIAAFNTSRGYLWMSAAIALGLPLAVLSKENGILLCAYLLVLEATLLASQPRPRQWRAWAAVFLVSPLLLLAGYFAINWGSFQSAFAFREFSQGERLLTQPRILFEYLYHIFLPSLGGSGLFHDDYRFSTGLFTPPQTALALSGLLAAVVSALWLRRRYPVYAFAVLWFLAGHILESSFISLELYFEHRNYLPMLGPVAAVIYGAARLPQRHARIAAAGLCLFIGMLALLSYQSAKTWGDERLLANTWAIENPGSARAQQFAADYWVKQGELPAALYHLQAAAEANPSDLSVHIQIVLVRCMLDDYRPEEFATVLDRASTGSYSNATVSTIDQIARLLEKRDYDSLGYDDLQALLDALLENPKYAARSNARRNIWYAKGKIYFAQRELTPAIESLDKAYQSKPDIGIPLLQAGLLLSAGLPEAAEEYYRIAEQTNAERPWYQMDRSGDLENMESLIERKTD